MLSPLPAALIALASLAQANQPPLPASPLTVYHRFASPEPARFSLSNPNAHGWVARGWIQVVRPDAADGVLLADTVPRAYFTERPDAWDGLVAPQRAGEWAREGKRTGGERYEVAVRGPRWEGGPDSGERLPFVSVDACHLYTSSSPPLEEHLTLSWSSSPDGSFTGAIGYRTSTSAQDAPCRLDATEKELSASAFGPERDGGRQSRVSVRLETPREVVYEQPAKPAQPKEQQPVTLDEDGKIIPPPKEKSFIQKYWMYIVPAVLILLMSGSEPAAEGGGQGGSGGGGGKR
ncbi:hypothetical protein JCM10207_005266 [Rhodosporidiobolus poonsookiae]